MSVAITRLDLSGVDLRQAARSPPLSRARAPHAGCVTGANRKGMHDETSGLQQPKRGTDERDRTIDIVWFGQELAHITYVV